MDDITIVKNSLKKNRFELEIQDIKLYSNKTAEIQERLNYLQSEYNKLNNSQSTIPKSTSNEELTKLFNKIDQNIQKQSWHKLPKFIQNQKIQEFIYNKEHNINKAKEYYKIIYNDILSKKIKQKDIEYDSKICKIIHIKNIEKYL